MILADKIIALRKKNGWSQEELAERLEVSRQSVSKWESGLSMPDMNKILGMSALFGVSTDYLLKDELGEPSPSETADTDDAGAARTVEIEEANRYMDAVARLSWRIALGVMMCILSPIALILLCGLADVGAIGLSENAAAAIGLSALFVLVGGAVALFVVYGLQLSAYSYLDTECFTLGYGVKGIVEKKRDAYRPRFIGVLAVAIVMCIVSALPLLVFGVMEAKEAILIGCVGLILAVCAVAVFLMVRVCYINGSFERLLQTGEFSVTQKRERRKNEAAEGIYWSVVTASYLIISFLTMAWHITWIIWVAAGCLFPLFELILRAARNKKE